MSGVTRVNSRSVKVGEDVLDAADVIELAEALIQTHGWLQNDGGSELSGWSMHGAIGEAARRLGEYDEPSQMYGLKDGPVARPLRDAASRLLGKVLPDGEDEFTFNDKADSVDAVIALMQAARGA